MVRRRHLLSTIVTGGFIGSITGFGARRARGERGTPVWTDHDDYPEQRDDERVQLIDADPEFGFNYPYWLATPENFRSGPIPLMLEGNNARKGEDVDRLEDRVLDQITRFELQGPWLSEELGVPQLIPLLPRPEGDPVDKNHEPFLLDRDSMLLESTTLERPDLQLLRMAEHAKQHVLADQEMHEKVIFYGNSAGGVVGERMAAMHPDAILAVAGGAMNGFVVLPQADLGGHTLNYPVGVADFESLLGTSYDRDAHDEVDKFYFLGDEDPANRLPMEGGYGNDIWNDKEVYDAARAVYGSDPVIDRFPRCHIAFQKAGVRAQFRIYEGMTHNPEPASHDILAFFDKSIEGEDVSEFGHRLELPLDREIEILEQKQTENGMAVDFTVSGDYPPPDGLVSYTWELGDGATKKGSEVAHTYAEPARYNVTLAMETAHDQQVETEREVFFEAPSFELVAYELSTEEVRVGESVTVSATVANSGTQRGAIPVEFSVNDRVAEETSVDLDVDETAELTFVYTFETTGEFELSVNDASMGAVAVKPEATSTPHSPPPTSQVDSPTETTAETPGFGVLTVIAGLGSAVSYLVLGDERGEE